MQYRNAKHFILAFVGLLFYSRHIEGSTQSASANGVPSVLVEDGIISATASGQHRWDSVVQASMEGVHLPAHYELDDGRVLYRNGHGLRSFTFYGLSMKIYVASVYSQMPIRSAEEALACANCPMVFQFVFLRTVSQSRVTLAWQKQLDWSVSYTYEGYKDDRAAFISMCGAMEDRGTLTVKFFGDETWVIDQGQFKGSIHGLHFQRAFLSMWFGEKAVCDDLKVALLGNTSSGGSLSHRVT